MKPITRKEYYLAKAAGTYTGPTPPPVLREDYYLATLAGDYSGNCPAPVTRIEKYMSAAAGLTTYVPQPVTRVEKYWYAIAKGTGYVPEPVTREEKFLYAILKNPPKPEYLDKTAEGSTILLTDSTQAPLTALTVYGHSTQDGTPSPENPVPIVSAGSVMTTGKNVLPPESHAEVHMNIPAGTKCFLVTDGTPSNGGNIYLYDAEDNIYYLAIDEGDTESTNPYGTTYNADIVRFENLLIPGVNTAMYIGEKLPYEPYTGGVPGVNPYEGEINVSVSDGGTQSQTLTLSTPGGLPGIPVDSGGNYTDESGQQWIADVKDYGTGKYTQNIGQIASYNGEGVGDVWMSSTGQLTTGANVIYQLATPIVTDISAEEIAAYQALHTYTPNTSVSNDTGAWVKVGYKAIP